MNNKHDIGQEIIDGIHAIKVGKGKRRVVKLRQATVERLQLDRFLAIFSGAPIGDIKKTAHPDFVITTSGGTIGVELTQLYKTGLHDKFQPRAVEAFREKIVDLAKNIYDGGNDIPLEVGVQFSGAMLTDAEVTARKLVSVIEELASGNETWCVVTDDDMDMPGEFSIIRIIKRPSQANCLWSVSDFGWLSNLDECVIQAAISKKNTKISEYQIYAHELWLLLVIDQEYLSSFFEVSDSIVAHTFESVFSKVILFSYMGKKCWTLKTSAPE